MNTTSLDLIVLLEMPTTKHENNNQTINFDKQIQPFPGRRWQSPQAGLQYIEAAAAAGNFDSEATLSVCNCCDHVGNLRRWMTLMTCKKIIIALWVYPAK